MFIYSIRAATLKFFGVLALSVLTLALLVVFVPQYDGAAYVAAAPNADYSGIRTNGDRVRFLADFGYTVTPDPIETADFSLPEELDRVLAGYNEIQKQQGLDLGRYLKKTVTRYTYEVTDYKGYEGKVYANLIVWRDRVIAADICSADPNGFVHGLTTVQE